MNDYEKSVVPVIEAKYDSFTNVEKNIAKYFLNTKKKADFSAKAVSSEIFVSEASLSRFAKKCGFHGYREFVYQFEENFVEKSEVVANGTRLVLKTYQELLNKTYNLMDEAKLERIVNYMYDADRVVACGKGSSGLAATEMENRFARVGVDIDSLIDTHRMLMQAVFQTERSLVCGISISGESEEVIYLLKESHKRGAKTVLFTANDKPGLSEFCTEVVLVASRQHLDLGNVISPQYPILVMIDIIYNNYVSNIRYSKRGVYDDTLRALREGNKEVKSEKDFFR